MSVIGNENEYNKTEWHVAYADIHEGIRNFWQSGCTFEELEQVIFDALTAIEVLNEEDLIIMDVNVYVYKYPELRDHVSRDT